MRSHLRSLRRHFATKAKSIAAMITRGKLAGLLGSSFQFLPSDSRGWRRRLLGLLLVVLLVLLVALARSLVVRVELRLLISHFK